MRDVGERGPESSVEELLDRAFKALVAGERDTAHALAGDVLAIDASNPEAEDLLAIPDEHDELRRLTILFADLVGSTELSTLIEPELYRGAVARYRQLVFDAIERYGGYIGSSKGDGHLALFGYPQAHENDAQRAVEAGLEITRGVAALSRQIERRYDFGIAVRVGIHRGLVYLDRGQDDVYGLAANLAARVSSIAEPNSVSVSAAIEALVRRLFEFESRRPELVKGIAEPVEHFRVLGERSAVTVAAAPNRAVIGRLRETGVLADAWRGVVSGGPATAVVLHGEAGVGKSTLARVAADAARQSGAEVVELLGSPLHEAVGLHPVRRLIERRCGIDSEMPTTQRLAALRADLAGRGLPHLLSQLAPVLGLPADAGYEPAPVEGRALHDQIVSAAREYIAACLGSGPALALLEDMHWHDPDTLEVLQLLRQDSRAAVLIVATTRDDPVLTDDGVEVLELGALDHADAEALVSALCPGAGAEQRAAAVARANGVPLYLEQVAVQLAEMGSDEAGVPDTLYETLVARLAASSGSRPIVEAAAVLGGTPTRMLLVSVSGAAHSEADEMLRSLVELRLFEPVEDDRWRFRHELLREVAAELVPPTRRRTLHGRAADALLAGGVGDTDWPLVASHLHLAERYLEAAAAYEEASASARSRGALVEARSHLTDAIGAIDNAEPDLARHDREIAVRLSRGFLAYAQEGPSSPDAATDFERCLELAELTGSHARLLSASITFSAYYAARADLVRLERLLDSVHQAAANSGSPLVAVYTDALYGLLAWYRGQLAAARVILEGAKAEALGAPRDNAGSVWFTAQDGVALIHAHLGLALFGLGDVEGARASFGSALARCAELGFPQGPFNAAYSHSLEILTLFDSGELDHAAQLADEVVRIGAEYGFDVWSMIGQGQQSAVAGLAAERTGAPSGDLRAHAQTLIEIVDLWRALGIVVLTMAYDVVAVRLLLAAGDRATARDRVDVVLALTETTQMRFCDPELLRLRSATHDDPEARRLDLAAARELAQRQESLVYELNATTDDFVLNGEIAREALVDVVSRFASDTPLRALDQARRLLG